MSFDPATMLRESLVDDDCIGVFICNKKKWEWAEEKKSKVKRIKIETKRGQWNETSTQKKSKWKLNKKGMNVDSKAKKWIPPCCVIPFLLLWFPSVALIFLFISSLFLQNVETAQRFEGRYFWDYKANGQIEMEQWEVYVGEWWRGNDKFHREQVLLDYFILCDV